MWKYSSPPKYIYLYLYLYLYRSKVSDRPTFLTGSASTGWRSRRQPEDRLLHFVITYRLCYRPIWHRPTCLVICPRILKTHQRSKIRSRLLFIHEFEAWECNYETVSVDCMHGSRSYGGRAEGGCRNRGVHRPFAIPPSDLEYK